jgi:hypothetical protein
MRNRSLLCGSLLPHLLHRSPLAAAIAAAVALGGLAGVPRPAASNPLVALNEVLADPARDWDGDLEVNATNDEWIEIVNTGAVPADLSELRLGDIDRVWAYGFSGTLPVEGHIVVYGSASKAWQVANGFSAFGLRLSNTGDTVVLWQVTATDTTIIDQYTFVDHEAEDDRSSGRRPSGGATWELFDALTPYSGDTPPLGNGCAPSPGLPNNCATPVEEATWGQIKARQAEGRMRNR